MNERAHQTGSTSTLHWYLDLCNPKSVRKKHFHQQEDQQACQYGRTCGACLRFYGEKEKPTWKNANLIVVGNQTNNQKMKEWKFHQSRGFNRHL